MVGGLAAGCSSDVTRFQDSILTGSSRTGPQQAAVQQAYPGDAQLDQTYTGSVASAPRRVGILNRAGLIPRPDSNVMSGSQVAAITPASNPYPSQAQPSYPSPARQAVTSSPLAPVESASLDSTATGSTSRLVTAAPRVETSAPVSTNQPAAVVSAERGGGWSRAGGTQIAVRPGETIYNLSRRFGVPVEAIMKANGLSSPTALAAGSNVVIPTYVHTANAGVSAPDANPNVADARSTTGTRFDVPAGQAPVPSQPPERLAVLPQQPKLKEREAGQPTATANANTSAGANTYTVVAGDTLSAIARRNGVTSDALKQANGLSNGLIRIGQTLTIPTSGGAATTQVASAPATDRTTTGTVPTAESAVTAYTPPQKVEKVEKAEKVIQQAALSAAPAPDSTGISRMRWPVRGRVISPFGSGSGSQKNDGIDIAVPAGTPVKAAENGVVIYAGDGLKEFGNTVLVRHEDGLVTVYGHASEINVQRGQKVRRGEEIALSGMSGSAETPKLHFEVRKESAPVDPVGYLE